MSRFGAIGGGTVLTDLQVDGTTVTVDTSNDRLGVGTASPGTQVQIESTAPYITLKNSTAENSDGGCESRIIFEDHADVALAQIQGSHDGSSDDTKGDLIFSTHDGTSLDEALRIDSAQLATFAAAATVTTNLTVGGDIILDDGGSLKEAGGTAAITFDGDGNVTKIGQDTHTSGQFLKFDGSKFVLDAASGGGGASDLDDLSDVSYSSGDLTITSLDTLTTSATAHNAAGQAVLIQAGNTTAGTTNNIAGGSLTLAAGQGKGSGAGGDIIFKTANAGGSGSSLNSLATALTISDDLSSTFAGNVTFGVDDTGVDVRIFSATASEGVLYDASEDELALLLTTKLKFHDVGGGEEIFASANGHLEINAGTTLDVTAPTVDLNGKVQIDSLNNHPALLVNCDVNTASNNTTSGLSIDFDKTAATTSDNTMYGMFIDMDNTTATNGTNTMIGINVAPTLTHAADAGLPTVKGITVTATGGTNGTAIATGMELTSTGADVNNGLIINCADGGNDLIIQSSADTGDYFQIATTANGATTI